MHYWIWISISPFISIYNYSVRFTWSKKTFTGSADAVIKRDMTYPKPIAADRTTVGNDSAANTYSDRQIYYINWWFYANVCKCNSLVRMMWYVTVEVGHPSPKKLARYAHGYTNHHDLKTPTLSKLLEANCRREQDRIIGERDHKGTNARTKKPKNYCRLTVSGLRSTISVKKAPIMMTNMSHTWPTPIIWVTCWTPIALCFSRRVGLNMRMLITENSTSANVTAITILHTER